MAAYHEIYRNTLIEEFLGTYEVCVDFEIYEFQTLEDAREFIDRACEDGMI